MEKFSLAPVRDQLERFLQQPVILAPDCIGPDVERIVKRPEKYGGDLNYGSYEALESDFGERKLHPMDLKTAAAEYMNEILEPVRKLMQGVD